MIKTFIEGFVATAPELVTYGEKNDKILVKFRVGVNSWHKNEDDDNINTKHYFDCVLYDTGAKALHQYAKKGSLIVCMATPRQETWIDKPTQKNRSKVVFRIDEFRLPEMQMKKKDSTTEAGVDIPNEQQ